MTDHYFSSRHSADFVKHHFSFDFKERHFSWVGSRGVFASKDLDKGSQLLLHCFLKEDLSKSKLRILDLGCGTGVVGVLLALFIQDISVTCSDLSTAATLCTAENVEVQNVTHKVDVVNGQGAAHFRSASFSHVLLNPPIRAGNEVVFQLIKGACRVLRPNGQLFMVVRVKQGGKRLAELSKQWFASVEQIGRKKGFLVYKLAK